MKPESEKLLSEFAKQCPYTLAVISTKAMLAPMGISLKKILEAIGMEACMGIAEELVKGAGEALEKVMSKIKELEGESNEGILSMKDKSISDDILGKLGLE